MNERAAVTLSVMSDLRKQAIRMMIRMVVSRGTSGRLPLSPRRDPVMTRHKKTSAVWSCAMFEFCWGHPCLLYSFTSIRQKIMWHAWRFFQPGCVGRRPIRVWGGLVEPTTAVKVEAPLNGRVLWKGLPRVLGPRGSPYRINRKGKHQ